MRAAHKIATSELVRVTSVIIDRLLSELPDRFNDGYHTDHSDEITGYKGVSAHLYTAPNNSRSLSLQVMGPERMISAIAHRYGRHYTVWAREPGKVILQIRS